MVATLVSSVINDHGKTCQASVSLKANISTIASKIKVPLDMVWDAREPDLFIAHFLIDGCATNSKIFPKNTSAGGRQEQNRSLFLPVERWQKRLDEKPSSPAFAFILQPPLDFLQKRIASGMDAILFSVCLFCDSDGQVGGDG